MKKILTTVLIIATYSIYAQVGIGNTNPDASSLLDVRDDSKDKGILIPRVDITDLSTAAPITSPIESLMVYNENTTTGKGFYYWDGSKWVGIVNPIRINDLLDGKSDVDGSNDGSSVYLGIDAGAADDASHNKNVGVGFNALKANVGTDGPPKTGQNNTAVGYIALAKNTDGKNNTAIGLNTLKENITGDSNVAVGSFSQALNITGNNNVAVGNQSLRYNESGTHNTAIGDYALKGDADDSAIINGYSTFNVAIGNNTLYNLSSGTGNVAIGVFAGSTLASGDGNIFIGNRAGQNATGDNKLYIDNSNTATPLIYGDFAKDKVTINDVLNIAPRATAPSSPATGDLYVNTNGHIYCYLAGSWKQLDN